MTLHARITVVARGAVGTVCTVINTGNRYLTRGEAMPLTALVDADVITYTCGFAVEKTTHITPDGEHFSTLGKAKLHCSDVSLIKREVEYEPLDHCLHLVKNCLQQIQNRTSCTEMRIFLSGENNFREKIATIKPYKGNRPARKPHWYNEIRQYLIDIRGAEVVQGMEADDAMGIYSVANRTIICTVDKDLDQIEGLHYNFKKDTIYDIDTYSALRNFYIQLLMGDSTDNIRGVPGIGKQRARKLLKGNGDEEEMYWTCLNEYCRTHDRPYESLIENARLLFILREPKQKWEAPV